MKSLILAILAVASSAVAIGQQKKWTPTIRMTTGVTLPSGGMKQNIKAGYGFAMDALFEAPSQRIATGIDFNFSQYGRSKATHEFEFDNGTSAPMDIIVNNIYLSVMATARIYFVLDGPVRPFASIKAGYTHFNTNLSIIDPDDGDSCEPVESDILMRDGTFAYSAGGGVRVDAARMFRKVPRNMVFIELAANTVQGGRVNYMNEDAPSMPASHRSATRAKSVEARFVDTQTQVVHAHHVGYLYNSFVQLIDFHLGVSFRVN